LKAAYELDIIAKTHKADEASAIMDKIPMLITVRQALLSDSEIAAKLSKEKNPDISDLKGNVLFSEIINPAYEEMQVQIATINAELVEAKALNERNEKLIPDTLSELEAIEKFIKTGDSSGLDNGRYNVLDKRVVVTQYASIPDSPEAPRKARNILIAVFLSLIIGSFVALSKNYWQNN